MRSWEAHPFSLALVLAAFGACPGLAAPAYRFTPGETNAFEVHLETTVQEQRMALIGIVYASVAQADEQGASLRFSGQLAPRRVPASGQAAMVAPPMHLLRPGAFPAFFRSVNIHPNHEFLLDRSGRVIREAGHAPEWPVPLGGIVRAFIEPLPTDLGHMWESTMETFMDDHGPPFSPREGMPGMGPPQPFGRSPARLSAVWATRGRVTFRGELPVAIQVETAARSRYTVEGEPRMQVNSLRETTLDPERGLPLQIKESGQIVIRTALLIERRPFQIDIRRLPSDEVAEALRAMGSAQSDPPQPIGPEELAELVAMMRSPDPGTRASSIARLHSAEIVQPTGDLVAAAIELAGDRDLSMQHLAARLLGKYGSATELPVMLRLLAATQPGVRGDLIEALRRLRDPRAIDMLADIVARGSHEADSAADVLASYGPDAEDAGLKLLQHAHAHTRRLAAILLGRIGGAQCLKPLMAQMLDQDQQVSQAAMESIRAIRSRVPDLPEPSER